MIQYSRARVIETRRHGVLDTPLSRSMTGTCLKHAIADREGIVEFGTGRFTHLRKGDPIGQMPWSELIGVTWACREPQLELALDLARQIQDHNAVRGRRPISRGALSLFDAEITGIIGS